MDEAAKYLNTFNIMTKQEQEFLNIAFNYKVELDNTEWWKFRKRYKLKRSIKSALECMIRYGK